MDKKFRALRIFEEGEQFVTRIVERNIEDLPTGDVVVKVEYSSLNYKDALSVSGNRGVTRQYPHTPGIDASGVVASSNDSRFKTGDKVIVTSYDLGMNTDGGFAEYIRVPADWVVKLPEKMDCKRAMVFGTAGFTAALAVYRLLKAGQTPEMGEIVVTGALGGVGSVAIGILSAKGFKVIAATSNDSVAEEKLINLGASSRITAEITDDQSGRPLLRPQWAGAIDVVGGNTLHTLIKACKPLGNVTTCGNIGSGDLAMTVYPFILNGVSLIGIDSQNCPMAIRQDIWNLLADEWNIYPDTNIIETTLDDVDRHIDLMLKKQSRGRVVVKVGVDR